MLALELGLIYLNERKQKKKNNYKTRENYRARQTFRDLDIFISRYYYFFFYYFVF